MADDTQQDAPPIDVPTIQIGIEVGLRGITVKIPETFWTDPGQNIVAPDGFRIWQHRMNACMAAIAQGFTAFVTDKGYMLENGELRVPADTFAPPKPTEFDTKIKSPLVRLN